MIVEIDNNYLEPFHSSGSELYDIIFNDGFVASFSLDHNKHYDEVFIKTNL